MRTATLDPALRVRVVATRELHYRDAALPGDDRPPHVRAASGIAMIGGRLAVVQDDTSFIALVGPGGAMSIDSALPSGVLRAPAAPGLAIALPRGRAGRRRFEDAIGNKSDKLDLESCLAIAGELWAFGSGCTDRREQIARVGDEVRLYDAAPLYAHVRRAVGSAINIEGIAALDDELWLLHRGNTGTGDAGPAIVRFAREPVFQALLEGAAFPAPVGCDRYDLGTVSGVPLGFTDAIAGDRRVFYLAAAESSANAIDDGPIAGSQLGVIDGDRVRAATLELAGQPIKAEGLAFDPHDPRKGWIVIDPDDTEQAAPLLAFELDGPW